MAEPVVLSATEAPGVEDGLGPAPEPLDAFTERARAFLDAHVPQRVTPAAGSGTGARSDRVPLLEESDPDQQRRDVARARAWRRELFDAGLTWITGPRTFGGQGLSEAHERRFGELLVDYQVPDPQPLLVGLQILAPALARHGSHELKVRYLPALYRGDIVGCQLFSEPEAGSDLAGVRTRAERDEATGDWIVTGQKVWSSGAAHADLGEALVRTDPDAPKHRGLSLLLVDMHDPGVTVRPIRQMTGGAAFNEVFLDEVRVPAGNCIGELGEGWRVASVSLASERAALGGAADALPADLFERLVAAARQQGLHRDPVVRQELAHIRANASALDALNARAGAGGSAQTDPAAMASIAKLLVNRQLASVVALIGRLLGPALVADTGAWGTFAWAEFLLGVPSLRIAGGTDEIQHNILSERALGLPRSL